MPGRAFLMSRIDASEPHFANPAFPAFENKDLWDIDRRGVPHGAKPSTKYAPCRGTVAPGQAVQRSKGCTRPLSYSAWLHSQPHVLNRKSRSSSTSRSWKSRLSTRCKSCPGWGSGPARTFGIVPDRRG